VNKVLDMVKGKARAAGSFLGGLANNPAIVIIALVLGGLFIFRDRISGAFGSLGESLSGGLGDINIQLPEIKLPEINFPEFNFPDFPDFTNIFDQLFKNQQSILAGQTVAGAEGDPVQIPPDTMIDPDTGIVTSSTPPTTQTTTGKGTDITTLFGELRPQVFDTLISAFGFTPAGAFGELKNITTIQGLGDLLNRLNEMAKQDTQEADFQGIAVPISPPKEPVQSFLIDQPTQKFEGGGISFTGGSIFETPIENLSLSQIIDKFNVTASQAANLKAIAQGFTPEEEAFLQGSQDIGGFFTGFNPPAVSNTIFQGLTPEEIALQLTGGNISNF